MKMTLIRVDIFRLYFIFCVYLSSFVHCFQNISTTGCVDDAGTQACFQQVTSNVDSACSSLCGCNDAFSCNSHDTNCLTSCACEASKQYINCVVSSCWNKVCAIPIFTHLLLISCYLGLYLWIPTDAHRRTRPLSNRFFRRPSLLCFSTRSAKLMLL